MYFERYLLRTRNNTLTNVFNGRHINNLLYSLKTISNENLFIYNEEPLRLEINYASYQNVIATYTKPELIYTTSTGVKLFGFKIIYAKTSENQAIVNVSDWNQLSELDSNEGPAYTLNVYCAVNGNLIRFALEYQYHALPNNVIYKLLRTIAQDCFLNTQVLESVFQNDDFELCMDLTSRDYQNIFNNATRSKQVILHIDKNTERGEIINSGKMIYSIKANSDYTNAITFIQNKMSGNGISSYVIKCEDSDGRIATLEQNINTNNWEQPARIEIDIKARSYINNLLDFLRS